MRIALAVIAAASCLATPALAQGREARIADRLNDPVVQEGLTAAVATIAGILLDTRVDSLSRYSEGRVRPGDTLRDVKRREDPGFERRLRQDTRRTVRTAGVAAGDMASAVSAIAATTARLEAALAPLADGGGDMTRRDDDDRYEY